MMGLLLVLQTMRRRALLDQMSQLREDLEEENQRLHQYYQERISYLAGVKRESRETTGQHPHSRPGLEDPPTQNMSQKDFREAAQQPRSPTQGANRPQSRPKPFRRPGDQSTNTGASGHGAGTTDNFLPGYLLGSMNHSSSSHATPPRSEDSHSKVEDTPSSYSSGGSDYGSSDSGSGDCGGGGGGCD